MSQISVLTLRRMELFCLVCCSLPFSVISDVEFKSSYISHCWNLFKQQNIWNRNKVERFALISGLQGQFHHATRCRKHLLSPQSAKLCSKWTPRLTPNNGFSRFRCKQPHSATSPQNEVLPAQFVSAGFDLSMRVFLCSEFHSSLEQIPIKRGKDSPLTAWVWELWCHPKPNKVGFQ